MLSTLPDDAEGAFGTRQIIRRRNWSVDGFSSYITACAEETKYLMVWEKQARSVKTPRGEDLMPLKLELCLCFFYISLDFLLPSSGEKGLLSRAERCVF